MSRVQPVPFLGGSNTARSSAFDAQRSVNLFAQASASGQSKNVAMLLGTPGLKLWATMSDAPIRGLLRINANLAVIVAGASVFTCDATGVATLRGNIAAASTPVSMASNGATVMIVTGAFGYFLDLTSFALTWISDPDFTGADHVDYLDGYFVWNKPGTQFFQWSQLLGTNIDALDIAASEGSPDILVTQLVNQRELWNFGASSTEPFFNAGDADNPFQRIQGAFIEQGCAAKFSPAKIDGSVFWLSADDKGQGMLMRANGYVPQRVSTHDQEFAWAQYSRIDDAVAYTYQQEGHSFYQITFPTANATWVFDATTSLWHERAWRDPADGSMNRHRSICQMAFANSNLVGDWQSGKIYQLDLNTFTDDGNILLAIRQCPHFASPDNTYMLFDRFWVDMEAGVGLNAGQGSDPIVMISWSDDGGVRFGQERQVRAGKIGQRTVRAIVRRTGRSRDRVWRVSISDPVKRVLIGAGATVRPCSA